MNFLINDKIYNVKIIRKNNKNTYIRLKDDIIQVTTNYFVTNKRIKKLIEENIDFLIKNVKKEKTGFYIMGKKLEVIYRDIKNTIIENNIIITKNEKSLLKFQNEKVKEIFTERLNFIYNKFNEKIPFPKLKIRKMKSRWGVCNRKSLTVTLNYNLINYDYTCLDYVIIHELAHFVHFDHSKAFWSVVEKYEPNYKLIKKKLKN